MRTTYGLVFRKIKYLVSCGGGGGGGRGGGVELWTVVRVLGILLLVLSSSSSSCYIPSAIGLLTSSFFRSGILLHNSCCCYYYSSSAATATAALPLKDVHRGSHIVLSEQQTGDNTSSHSSAGWAGQGVVEEWIGNIRFSAVVAVSVAVNGLSHR